MSVAETKNDGQVRLYTTTVLLEERYGEGQVGKEGKVDMIDRYRENVCMYGSISLYEPVCYGEQRGMRDPTRGRPGDINKRRDETTSSLQSGLAGCVAWEVVWSWAESRGINQGRQMCWRPGCEDGPAEEERKTTKTGRSRRDWNLYAESQCWTTAFGMRIGGVNVPFEPSGPEPSLQKKISRAGGRGKRKNRPASMDYRGLLRRESGRRPEEGE